MAQLAANNRPNLNDFQQSLSQQQVQQQRSLSNTSANQESFKKHSNNFGRPIKREEICSSAKLASRSSISPPSSKIMAISNENPTISCNNIIEKDSLKEDQQQFEKNEANNLTGDFTNNVIF